MNLFCKIEGISKTRERKSWSMVWDRRRSQIHAVGWTGFQELEFLMNFLTCYPTILIDFFGVDSIGDSRIWSLPFIRSSKHLGISFLTLKWAFGSFMLVSPACLCLYGFAHVLRIGSVSHVHISFLNFNLTKVKLKV